MLVDAFVRVFASLGFTIVAILTAFAATFFAFDLYLETRSGLAAVGGLLAIAAVAVIRRRLGEWVVRFAEESATAQAAFLERIADRQIPWLIVLSAGLSLFFELIMIRWQGSLFPTFAFYKNFTLLACFVGLGLGYAVSDRRSLPLALVLPMVAAQVALLIALRYGAGQLTTVLMTVPITEQTHMGTISWSRLDMVAARWIALAFLYGLLALTFATTVLIFVPIGQLCGHFLDRRPRLPAYGGNLLGSLLGTLAFAAISYFWTSPVIWFAAVVAALLLFQDPRAAAYRLAVVSGTAVVVALAWPVEPLVQKVYSPYQLIERTSVQGTGLMQILSAGKYYQKVYDFSPGRQSGLDPQLAAVRDYYDLPFRANGAPGKVAIVGAGSGNDVAAALRAGATRVDAIEIDPVIAGLGTANHPEAPYSDPRVRRIVNDARTFFRTSDERYDTIVYGVLDSHTQLSHASNVRLDSFVYTVEGFAESYRLLNEGGLLSVSFALLAEAQGRRIFEMIRRAAGGKEPVAVQVGYDSQSTVSFLLRKGDGQFDAAALGFPVSTDSYRGGRDAFDVPTDDWPFFYMAKKTYPVSYLPVLGLMMLLSIYFSRRLVSDQRPDRALMSFFFLGAGFMLVETKAITEFGLLFGNTWQVIGVVISAILFMAFLANLAVEKLRLRGGVWAYAGVLGVIGLGYAAVGMRFVADYQIYRLAVLVLLTVPMLFSGIVFSSQLRASPHPASRVLAYNIMGAMLGGLLEYNSMYFGFSFLYLVAFALYALALACARGARAGAA